MTLLVSSAGSSLGTGGMSTKLTAARLATSVGTTTVITRSSIPSNILQIVSYIQSLHRDSEMNTPNTNEGMTTKSSAAEIPSGSAGEGSNSPPQSLRSPLVPLHTRFLPKTRAIKDRYFWILHGLKPRGTLYIDEGAHRALTRSDKAGLLPVGVVDVKGTFARQECVSLVVVKRLTTGYEPVGGEVGRALVNYTSMEIARLKGERSSRIGDLIGYAGMSNH